MTGYSKYIHLLEITNTLKTKTAFPSRYLFIFTKFEVEVSKNIMRNKSKKQLQSDDETTKLVFDENLVSDKRTPIWRCALKERK